MTTLAPGHALRIMTYILELAETCYANRPLSVAVCDANGELLSFARIDNAKPLAIELTQRKARTSSRLGCTTQVFSQRLQKEQLDINYSADPYFMALPSRIPILRQGKRLGVVAVGDSPTREDHDAMLLVVEILPKKIAQ